MKKEKKRFDMYRVVNKPRWYFKVVEFLVAPLYTWFFKGSFTKDPAIKKMKGPFLVLSSHAAFMDFPQLAAALLPETTGWVVSVDEFR